MKKFLLIVLGLVVVLIGAALVLPFVIPTETYKQQLTTEVERATGRQLTIQGPLQIALLPSVALKAENLRFANAPGAADPDMVKLKTLEVELKVLPLLHGAVEVARFVLVEPEIHLEVDQSGRPNWQLGTGTTSAANPAPASGGGGGGTKLPVTEIKLGDIRIQNGTLTYRDATSGASERIEAINLALDLPDLASPLEAHGGLGYKGQTIQLSLALQHPLEVIQGGASPLRLAVDSSPARFGFEGKVTNGAAPSAAGGLDLNVPSIRALAAWLGQPLEFQGEGLQTLSIKGKLDGSATRVALTDVAIGLDQIAAKGELTADLGGKVPKVAGRLDLGAVDLNPYLPPEAAQGAQPATTGGEQPAGGGRQTGSRQATTTPAPAPAPTPPAGAAAADWSDAPIALPPLGAAEVAFELTLDSLRVRKLELGRTVLGLTLQGGALEAALKQFALYDGHGSGTLKVALQNGAPAISQQFKLEGLQALPFLSAAADLDRLEGTVSADLSLTTRGQSERQLVQNLNGTGKVMFADGAIVGINLAAMVRNAAGAFLNPEAAQTQKTDFAELGGTFTVKQGILKNDDMHLQAPVLRVGGRGTVDLPKRTLDYRIEPKAASTLEGQGGKEQVTGILVPVMIRGPWADPKITPDLSGVLESALKNPEAVQKQLDQLGDQAKDLKKALKGAKKNGGNEALLEGLTKALDPTQNQPPDGDTPAKDQPKKPEEQVQKLLKGLLGN